MDRPKVNFKSVSRALSDLMWVGQLGFSLVTPPVLLGVLGMYLCNKKGMGSWVVIALIIVGVLTAISTAKGLYRDYKKREAREEAGKPEVISFTDHY